MKVNRNRHGLTLHGAFGVCVALAGAALWLSAAPRPAAAQSAGMANLLHGHERPSTHASEAASSQREARARAERHRAEQREAERAGHQGRSGSSLSPDERRKLRQNLYDLGREMYQGG
ncbi:hypothetical protein [Cupriavidus pinatubonensis]|uniref:Transmembrane protein n=1 Tax=Cupriavidus pinatubonensis TaxID=248026 RepID=A0ABN7Z040_9BURK|nr:hypothetical protein [Cupriavidus pinatubonensis]CAG9178170.1 hypothetical protein LMG23994_03832 [Cupriavidus pinatubonensis]